VIDEVAARRGTDSGAVLAEVGANGDPADGAGVSAPMLQLVLTRVWDEERSLGSTVLTLATFRDRLKGAENIARTQLDSTMNALGEHEKYVAAKAFERLVTPSGSKYVMSVGDLAAVIEEPRETVADVMKKLADGRILNPVSAAPGTDDQRYEILHDALGRTVLDWSTRHLAEREAQVSTQRARRITAIASGVAAFCLLLAVAAVIFAVDAKRQRETSRSQDRAAQAMIALASDDPVGALRHAVRANDASRTAAAEEALRRAYDAVRFTHVLDDPGRSVDAAAFGPGGDIVTLGSGRLRLRDAATRTDETEMKQYLGSYFAASADGSRVAVAGPDTIRIFDTKTWRQIAQGPSKRDIEGIALSDDGRFLAIAYWLAVDVVDVANATWVATDLGLDRESLYYGVAFSPSGDVLVAATSEGAELWDWRQAEVTRTLAARERAVTNVAFDTEGRLLTVGGETIRVWTTGGQLEAELRAPSRVRSATFSPNGRLIASASANGTAHVWHVATETRLAELIGHRGAVNSVGFSNEGTQLVTGGADGTARVWPLTGDRVLKYPANEVVSAAVSADGKLVATGASDGSGRVVEIETGGVTQDLQTYYAYEGDAAPVNDIALSARGDMVVLATDIDLDNDSSVTNVVWPTADGDENLFAYSGSVDASAVAFHPDGNWIATNARDGVDVWEARKAAKGDKREIRFLEHGKGLEVGALAFDRSGDRLATGATDGRVRIWSWRTRATQPLVSKERHRGAVNDVAFSTEGNLLASGGSDAKVFLWDATNGELRGELTGHTGAVNGVAFSHDGRLLASAGDDGTVRISSVSERRLLGIARPHSGAVTSVSFTPNGRIVSSGEDGTIRRSACTTCLPLERLLDAAERRLDALHVKVDD
jgi:WD40 repeat protein